MPWSPSDAKKKYKKLTKKQAEIWSKVANSALANGDDDATAIKKANAAVSRMRKSEALVEGAQVLVEVGRMISSSNMEKLKTAVTSMKTAVDTLTPLLGDDGDDDEDVSESVRLDEASKVLAQSDSYDSIRWAVQSALRKRAISDSIAQKVNDGADLDYYDYGCMPYIRDMYDDFVVYSLDGELYQCEYSVDDNTVTLGTATPVKISYVPTTVTTEAKEIEIKGDLIQLNEKAVRDDGTARVKVISPGWGSSGYYSKEMLKRDGPKVFPKGLHMYMNHPTEEEDRNRPERDLRDLAGVINSDVVWEDASASNTGDGLYAEVKVFTPYKSLIDEAAPYIGTSIRAAGTAFEGEAENRHGYIIDSLKEGYSVDYVTMPGRGGEVLSLYESARKKINVEEVVTESIVVKEVLNVDISKEELDALKESANKAATLETRLNETTTALTESQATIQKMQTALIVSEARTLITETLTGITMPTAVREKLQKACARNIPLTEAKELDRDKLIERVKEEAQAELKYIESVTGSVTGGKVVGMSSQVEPKELNAEEVDNELAAEWGNFGLSEKASKIAAAGRLN